MHAIANGLKPHGPPANTLMAVYVSKQRATTIGRKLSSARMLAWKAGEARRLGATAGLACKLLVE
jgi:hypothetical protein